jgi:hypothetical protein
MDPYITFEDDEHESNIEHGHVGRQHWSVPPCIMLAIGAVIHPLEVLACGKSRKELFIFETKAWDS